MRSQNPLNRKIHGRDGLTAYPSAKHQKPIVMFLATTKQIQYLQALADRAEYLKMRHPSLIPQGLCHIKWDNEGVTSDKASRCIQFYNEILRKADEILHPMPKDDLPA